MTNEQEHNTGMAGWFVSREAGITAMYRIGNSAITVAIFLAAFRIVVSLTTDAGPEFFERIRMLWNILFSIFVGFGIYGYGAAIWMFVQGKWQDRRR